MKGSLKGLRLAVLSVLVLGLSGCSDPHVYGSIGISTGYSSWGHGGWGGGIGTNISIGGRIH
ncbi:hypothetical protein [Parahaliea mediterranea]|uniref:hypothetical protein n=1 Tax=Parahaliea mediterranea TaxID=651086 RepID=UPI0013002717|nr:hypothetical protein [Parahaliea mediterranea]